MPEVPFALPESKLLATISIELILSVPCYRMAGIGVPEFNGT
jgi:hypothetical protein